MNAPLPDAVRQALASLTLDLLVGDLGLVRHGFNPLLILGWGPVPALGIAGSAYATLIGWGIGVLTALWLLRGTPLPLNLALLRNCSLIDPAKAIIRVGLPAAISNAINPLGLAILTSLVALESEAAVAGFGAASTALPAFSLALLLRSRWAVQLFWTSLIGLAVSLVYSYGLSDAGAAMGQQGMIT